jgi:beta-xylosidase
MCNHNVLAHDLLSRMTLREKFAQMYSVWLFFHDDGRVTLKLPQFGQRGESDMDPFEVMKDGIGQISRPLGTRPLAPIQGIKALNRIQKFLVDHTRLGIPALPHEECLAGVMAQGATLFPSGLNLGSLWDEALVAKVAAMIGDELWSTGSRQGLAPVLDVSRDVRWGRTEETLGEDPYLVACLALAYTDGLQGKDRKVSATLKHFAGHSFSEGGRNHAPVHIGPRELYDTFLLPFEMVIKNADVGGVLPAYHDIDGIPFHASHTYLTDILRKRWGFKGLVVSDYMAISFLHQDQKVAVDLAEAAALAVNAGIDMELPGFDCFAEGLAQALDRGLIKIDSINQAVRRVLVEKSRLGLFKNPYANEGLPVFNSVASGIVASEAAIQSIVLLKNNGILPLTGSETVALIGPLADERLCMLGGYSFPVHLISSGLEQHGRYDSQIPTLKEALSSILGDRLRFEKGCEILRERPRESPVFPGDLGLEGNAQKSYVSFDETSIPAAVIAAEKADCIIAAVGDLAGLFLTGTVGEGSDSSSLCLPGVQQKLLEALAATGKPLIVVMFNGRPYNIGQLFGDAAAVLEAWLPGQEGAMAVKRILFGESNPGGKLPVSIPKEAGAMPFYYNYKLKSAGTPIQNDFGAEYPFGFGLSYTTFSLEDFRLQETELAMDGTIILSCKVRNTGEREGDEVIQLYVHDLYASIVRPVRELKGFKRIRLKPGTAAELRFSMPTDILSFTGYDLHRILEPGEYEIMLGTSSRDIVFRQIVTLKGSVQRLGEQWRMLTKVEVARAE